MKHLSRYFVFVFILITAFSILCFPSFAAGSGLPQSTNGQWGYMTMMPTGYMAIENISQLGFIPQISITSSYIGKTVRYCPGSSPDSLVWFTNFNWDSQYGLDWYTITLMTADKSESYVYNGIMPQKAGTYFPIISLNCNNVAVDVTPVMLNTRMNANIKIAHADNPTWTVEGSSFVKRCPDCGVVLSKVAMTEEVKYHLCVEQSVIPTVSTESKEGYSLPFYTIVYEGTGDTDYPASETCPTEVGTYTARLYLLSTEGDISSVTLESEPIDYIIEPHDWKYSTSEYSLKADCSACGEHAEVTIDTSTVYEASRTYDGGDLEYEVFYEQNWSGQDDIELYTVLFSGYQTISKNETAVYTDVYCKPTSTGNYSVRIAMLSDPDDPSSSWLSTKEKPYYLADISINQVTETSYGPTEIAQFKQPELVGNTYRVGTCSELMWCLYNKNSDCVIYLTNDIVVNPITVKDDGTVRSASYLLYTWDGFGSESVPFKGEIKGNGYTIYGIYHPSSTTKYAGLIDYGQDCIVYNLKIENSLIIDNDAGTIMGRYQTKTNSYPTGNIDKCSSLNCYIRGTSSAGGMVGWVSGTGSVGLTIRNCINDSEIIGTSCAGGLVGKCENISYFNVGLSKNIGTVSSGAEKGKAGGLVGYIGIKSGKDYSVDFSSCFNSGKVSASDCIGGIIGYIASFKDSCILISNCTSTGYLNRSTHQGGIVGYFENDSIYYWAENYSPYSKVVFLDNYYYDASAAFGSGCKASTIPVTELTKKEVQDGFMCSHYRHTESSHWNMVGQATCTENGTLELRCAVCNQVLESQTIRAHGHRFEYGVCTFCNADEFADDSDSLIGAIIGSPNFIIALSVIVVLVIAAVISFIVVKRKKSNNID